MDSIILFIIIAAISLILAILMGAFFVIAWIYMRRRVHPIKRLAEIKDIKQVVPTLLTVVPVNRVISQVRPKVKLLQARLHDMHLNLSRA